MDFSYSRECPDRRARTLQRFLEILPGFISWTIIIGMTVVSFFRPLLASAIMVAFVLYWVLRLLYMNFFLTVSYMRLSLERDTDWIRLATGLSCPSALIADLRSMLRSNVSIFRKISISLRIKQVEAAIKIPEGIPLFSDILHVIIFPVAKERADVLDPAINSLVNGLYPAERILLVIALEGRASDEVKSDVAVMNKKFKPHFMDVIIAEHPDGIAGEAKVKGANATWAARRAAGYLNDKGISFDNVVVSCFDADTVAHPEYLACLTYYFMITLYRTRASYQPIPVYFNNLWDVPSFARILDIGASFFQLVEATNTEKLVTFSSHSMSFKALVEVGYWPVDMISDDSAIFWKSFIHFDGKYQVVPIYTTVSMDIAGGRNWRDTFTNIYKQKRRWAWGVENLPIVLRAFLSSKTIPLYQRWMLGFRMFDLFVSWASWSFLLTVITWLPALFSTREFSTSTMYYMAPRIKTVVFDLSFIGLGVCMIISIALLSSNTSRQRLSQKLMHIIDWLAIPLVILVFSSIPALDAQTRLMFGRYMEFKVTDKFRDINSNKVKL